MNERKWRIQSIFVISFSIFVISICIGGITVTWALESSVSSAADQLLTAADNAVQVLRDGITKADTGIEKLEMSVRSIEDASAQLSQNVIDKGLVLVLLPTTKEQELTAAAQSVWADLAEIRDYLKAAQAMVQAIDSLPFIDLPELAPVEQLQSHLATMRTQVEVLIAEIGEFRSQTSTKISKITETTANIKNQMAELRSDLEVTDNGLSKIQTRARQLQRSLPSSLLWIAIAITLIAIWIVYSQFMVIQKSLSDVRMIDSPEATNIEDVFEDSSKRGIRSNPTDEIGPSDSIQIETEE